MEKLAQAGEGGEGTHTPFATFIITYKVAVYAPVYSPAERPDSLPLIDLYPYVYSVLQ